eukprot:TRINITY_DN16091_c0_g1_i1.p1 TRINITY_DN16091_c0_g1~~TRINITY_DN16091_c0_g1_i1.p1  ORF type:complete len:1258 (+),score=164.09 TRINITY_DN16091_c0_g1_i1:90-3863(+)
MYGMGGTRRSGGFASSPDLHGGFRGSSKASVASTASSYGVRPGYADYDAYARRSGSFSGSQHSSRYGYSQELGPPQRSGSLAGSGNSCRPGYADFADGTQRRASADGSERSAQRGYYDGDGYARRPGSVAGSEQSAQGGYYEGDSYSRRPESVAGSEYSARKGLYEGGSYAQRPESVAGSVRSSRPGCIEAHGSYAQRLGSYAGSECSSPSRSYHYGRGYDAASQPPAPGQARAPQSPLPVYYAEGNPRDEGSRPSSLTYSPIPGTQEATGRSRSSSLTYSPSQRAQEMTPTPQTGRMQRPAADFGPSASVPDNSMRRAASTGTLQQPTTPATLPERRRQDARRHEPTLRFAADAPEHKKLEVHILGGRKESLNSDHSFSASTASSSRASEFAKQMSGFHMSDKEFRTMVDKIGFAMSCKYKSLTQVFRVLDEDKSGVLGMKEMKEFLRMFGYSDPLVVGSFINYLDRDGSGHCTLKELNAIFAHYMQPGQAEVLPYQVGERERGWVAMANVETKGKGPMSEREFRHMIAQIGSVASVKYGSMRQAFKLMDRDNSGFLDLDELYEFLRNLGWPRRIDAERLFNYLDEDNSGSVGYEELRTLLKPYVEVPDGQLPLGDRIGEIEYREPEAEGTGAHFRQQRLTTRASTRKLTDKECENLLRIIGTSAGCKYDKVSKAMRKLDENRNGTVCRKEFYHFCRDNGVADAAQVDQLYDYLDQDGGGALGYEEVRAAFGDWIQPGQSKLMAYEVGERVLHFERHERHKAAHMRHKAARHEREAREREVEEEQRCVEEERQRAEAAATAQLSDEDLEQILHQIGVQAGTHYGSVRRAYRDMDSDKNGLVWRQEFADFARRFGYTHRPLVNALFDRLNTNGDGSLQFAEVCAVFAPYIQQKADAMLPGNFKPSDSQRPVRRSSGEMRSCQINDEDFENIVDYIGTTASRKYKNLRTLFRSLDSDHSGKVSRQEMRYWLGTVGISNPATADAFFNYLDRDGEGSVDYSELQSLLGTYMMFDHGSGECLPSGDGRTPMDVFYKGRWDDTPMTPEEFDHVIHTVGCQAAAKFKSMHQCFKCVDKDGTGSISLEELSWFLTILGHPEPSLHRRFFRYLDKDESGTLSRPELAEFLRPYVSPDHSNGQLLPARQKEEDQDLTVKCIHPDAEFQEADPYKQLPHLNKRDYKAVLEQVHKRADQKHGGIRKAMSKMQKDRNGYVEKEQILQFLRNMGIVSEDTVVKFYNNIDEHCCGALHLKDLDHIFVRAA